MNGTVIMVLLMFAQTATLAFSQVALKLAMANLKWEWSWSFIWHHVLQNAWLLFAVFLMIVANVFWLIMLHKYDFSRVYPLTSLGFVFGILAGLFIFHEQVGFMQWIGVAMVITGCMFIAEIGKKPKPKEDAQQPKIEYNETQPHGDDQEMVGNI